MTGTALILVGHGSARHPEAAAPILGLAEDIRRRGAFAEVVTAFMKQAPGLDVPERLVAARRIVVVPVFAGTGHYTGTLIPRAMGLDGAVTRRGDRTILYTAPAGTHPRIPALLHRRAAVTAAAAAMDPTRSSLLLIAHGSGRPGGAAETPRAIAAALSAMGTFAEVALAFLEQEPLAAGWASLVGRGDVVALPLLVAQGAHASEDIPPLFGLEPGGVGPVVSQGHRIALATGLGAEPDLVEVILDLVAGAVDGLPPRRDP